MLLTIYTFPNLLLVPVSCPPLLLVRSPITCLPTYSHQVTCSPSPHEPGSIYNSPFLSVLCQIVSGALMPVSFPHVLFCFLIPLWPSLWVLPPLFCWFGTFTWLDWTLCFGPWTALNRVSPAPPYRVTAFILWMYLTPWQSWGDRWWGQSSWRFPNHHQKQTEMQLLPSHGERPPVTVFLISSQAPWWALTSIWLPFISVSFFAWRPFIYL